MPKEFDDQVKAIKAPPESKKQEASAPWVDDYDVMDTIIAKLQPVLSNYKIKPSVILDRGDIPAMTIYVLSPKQTLDEDEIFGALGRMGYFPINPVRPMKLKSGARGIKFSVRKGRRRESVTLEEILESVADGTISLDEAAQLCISENVFDGSKRVGQRKIVKDPHRDEWLVVDSTDHVMWKGDRKECIEWAKLHPGTSKK